VVAVPLPDLRAFQITGRSTDQIEDAIAWMTADRTLAPTGRVTVVGVSFSGGLAIVAAGRPRLANHISTVVSLGGHANLQRTMRYLCTGQLPDGTIPTPHEYGAAIILLAAVDRVVPADQSDALRRNVTDFLDASSVASTDTTRAESMLEGVRARAALLPEPSRTLMHEVLTADLASLGPKLLPFDDDLGSDAALSPDRSPAPAVPVFLMHGSTDNVIPSSEAPLLADYLRSHGTPGVTMLVSPFLTHASIAAQINLSETGRLVYFWRNVFEAATRK